MLDDTHPGREMYIVGSYDGNDAIREEALEQMGFHVIRFTNEEVLYDTENVLQQIEKYFNE